MTSKIFGTTCNIDCYNPNCEFCQFEAHLKDLASDLGTQLHSVVILDFVNVEIDTAFVQIEFEAHENTKDAVLELYRTWLKEISDSPYLSENQDGTELYAGVVLVPSPEVWETWQVKDFINTDAVFYRTCLVLYH